jgi:hypothetical protein
MHRALIFFSKFHQKIRSKVWIAPLFPNFPSGCLPRLKILVMAVNYGLVIGACRLRVINVTLERKELKTYYMPAREK